MPEHFYVEVIGTIRGFEQTEEIDAVRARAMVDQVHAWPLHRSAVRPIIEAGWDMRHNIRIADAVYVELVRLLDAELVTSDRRLASAPRLGVSVVIPPA